MIQCPDCQYYPDCPGPDDERCPNQEYVNEDCINEDYTEDHVEHGIQKYVQFDDDGDYSLGSFESNCQPLGRKKVVLELHFVKKKTQGQIVEITNIPRSTVSYYICAYRKKIEENLKKLKN